MADAIKSDENNVPAWLKWSAGISLVLILFVVVHWFVGDLLPMHSMTMGG